VKKLTIILTVLLATTITTHAQWQQTNGPYGGTIKCIAISGSNIFAGAGYGGVFLSTNNGSSWAEVNTGLTNTYIRAACVIATPVISFANQAVPQKGVTMSTYAHPEVLVNTQWVADHLNDSNIRLLEVGWDTSEYESGHIPGTVASWGFTDIQRPDSHDIPNKAQVESMLSQAGIANSDTIIIYGGLSNLVAALEFWVLKIYGHKDVRLLDGGRQKWVAEGRLLTTEKPTVKPTPYVAQEPDWSLRADKDYIISVIGQAGHTIVDARPVDMYIGENKYGIERGGHIPTAVNIPAQRITDSGGNFQRWQSPLTHDDGSFKSVEELQTLFSEKGVVPSQNIVTYCVRGGLSTYMWFALTQLLSYPNVREYERSWAEWGNMADTPIEK